MRPALQILISATSWATHLGPSAQFLALRVACESLRYIYTIDFGIWYTSAAFD